MPFGETIVALATPSGESAIGMIRVSGPLSLSIIRESMHCESPIDRKASLAYFTNLQNRTLDQVIFTFFPENCSFTGEPMIEICCHGNPFILQKVIEDLVTRGCRIAEGGEFTKTAFLNKKIDLSQAEAVCDIIRARSNKALDSAQKQLQGLLGQRVSQYVDKILETSAQIEAYIDFPEEDLPKEDTNGPVTKIKRLINDLNELIQTSHYKNILQEGIKVVIMGAPNAGKSSLLNSLIGEERAIVAPEPGTTRDFISERIMLGGHFIRIIDTAGIHEPKDEIERMGIQKTLEKVEEADLHILVIDVSMPSPQFSEKVLNHLSSKNTIILENKIDLPKSFYVNNIFKDYTTTSLSLKTGEGLQNFRDILTNYVERELLPQIGPYDLIINTRHAEAFKLAVTSLEKVLENILKKQPIEFAASEIRQAVDALGLVVGKIDNEHMLDKLFSAFCIGK